MKAGDKIRVRGEGGNEATITVGLVFDERTIASRLESGSWTLVEDDKPKRSARKPAKSPALDSDD